MTINFDNISEESILNNISDLDIYEKYLGNTIELNKLYTCINPDHNDRNPSMGFYENNHNIKFKCFGCGESGNTIEFVKVKYKCDFIEAINKIKNDINYQRPTKHNIIPTKKYTDIIPTFRNFNIIDYNYWTKKYSIELERCLKFGCKPCKQVNYINKNNEYKLWGEHYNSNPIYCYEIGYKYKCYRPFAQKGSKWLANTGSFDIQGLSQLKSKGDLLIITKSLKDVMILDKLGYSAIALGSEANSIPDKLLDYLYSCFDNIVIFYDNDKAGIMYAERLSNEIQANYTYIPLEYNSKDISDFCEEYNIIETEYLMKKLF